MRLFICRLLLLLALAATAAGADVSERNVKLAQRVHDIFAAKCVDCHGSDLARPKGKFGYVLDLQRVADNPDWVVRGDPEASELYLLVASNEMPGEDADVPPLSPAELDTVKQWIASGAPGDLPPPKSEIVATSPAPPAAAPVHPLPLWKRTIRWIGRFHPVSTHFPVALMFVAVLAEGFAWFTRRESWLQTVRFLVVLAALGAVSATTLGWINAYFTSYVGESAAILVWHRWLGTGSAAWAVICAGLVVINGCKEGTLERRRFRGALLVGAILVGISGFLGSALIFGLDHYSWN
jgi:uncharacterized membrane protein/mono/diheme cytochrome c family protein